MNAANARILQAYGLEHDSDWVWRAQNYDPGSLQGLLDSAGLRPRSGLSPLVLVGIAVAVYFLFKKS